MDVLQGPKYGPNLLIHSAQEMKFSIKGFFHKYDQIRRKLRILDTFTEEIRKKLHFLCRVITLFKAFHKWLEKVLDLAFSLFAFGLDCA